MKLVKLELIWIGKKNRPWLEAPILAEVPAHSRLATPRVTESAR